MAQLQLAGMPVFDPLPYGSGQYVVALQSKAGELRALENLDPLDWKRLTPLIRILGPREGPGPLNGDRVTSWVRKVSAAIDAHTFYLDLLRLSPLRRVERGRTSEPVLSFLLAQCRKRGLSIVPVISVGSRPRHFDLLRHEIEKDHRGVAIRYQALVEVPPPGFTPSKLLLETARTLNARPEEVDVLVDLGCIDRDLDLTFSDMQPLLDQIRENAKWRHVVLLGTSMPATLGFVKEGTSEGLPRREWLTWREVVGNGGDDSLIFGDYAIQHPRPPAERTGPGMRANLRYTSGEETLLLRGTGPVYIHPYRQYRELCQRLERLPQYAGPEYSWGDRLISLCADGAFNSGSQETWRAVGTSHHIRAVLDQLLPTGSNP